MDVILLSKIKKLAADIQALVIGQFGTGFVTDTMLSDTGIKNDTNNIYTWMNMVKNAGGVLYLDARATTARMGLPKNSPLTNPWMDLSGLENDATPINMAGTTASGVNITDPLKPFWALDGIDDLFSFANTSSLDVTSAPLAIFTTVRIPASVAAAVTIFAKTTSSTMQYRFLIGSNNLLTVNLNSTTQIGNSVAITRDVFVNIGFIWDGTNVKFYVNGIAGGVNGTYTGTLTSQSYVRLGCRTNSADGLTHTSFIQMDIATVTLYTGSLATEANILRAEKAISKAYIGA